MATVTGFTAERMQEIEDTCVVDGEVVGDDLILQQRNGTPINAGSVRGPIGPTGGSILVRTSVTRPTGGDLFEGLGVYETDTKRFYIYDGTAWQYRGGPWICTSGTRPASPFAGLIIFETDTTFTYIYTGTAWRYIGGVIICTAATRPASPFNGLQIFETDTQRYYTHNGANWVFTKHVANEDKVEVSFVCAAFSATTTGVMTDFVNTGDITVPAWATKARVSVSLTGMFDQVSANHTYGFRAVIGTNAGGQVNDQGKGVGVRWGLSWMTTIALSSTGLKAFKIQAARLGGANTIGVDGSCHVNALIEFLP
jgi:hypothetical protein